MSPFTNRQGALRHRKSATTCLECSVSVIILMSYLQCFSLFLLGAAFWKNKYIVNGARSCSHINQRAQTNMNRMWIGIYAVFNFLKLSTVINSLDFVSEIANWISDWKCWLGNWIKNVLSWLLGEEQAHL